eukprot:jgi/Ulvmu1/10653/UM066_0034.1
MKTQMDSRERRSQTVELEQLLIATQARCRELENQLHAQEQSAEKRCADLRSAFEAQISVLRKSVTAASQLATERQKHLQDSQQAVLNEALAMCLADAIQNIRHPTKTQDGSKDDMHGSIEARVVDLVKWLSSEVQRSARPTGGDTLEPVPAITTAATQIRRSSSVSACVSDIQNALRDAVGLAADPGCTPSNDSSNRQVDEEVAELRAQLQEQEARLQQAKSELQQARRPAREAQAAQASHTGGRAASMAQLKQQLQQAQAALADREHRLQEVTAQHVAQQAASEQARTSQPAGVAAGAAPVDTAPAMVAALEAQLGRLASVVRTKDAEATALSAAVQRQFTERADLRGQVAALDGQLARLQAAHADVEARLHASEARCAALDSKHNRVLSTEERAQKRFRHRRLLSTTPQASQAPRPARPSGSASLPATQPGTASGSKAPPQSHAGRRGSDSAAPTAAGRLSSAHRPPPKGGGALVKGAGHAVASKAGDTAGRGDAGPGGVWRKLRHSQDAVAPWKAGSRRVSGGPPPLHTPIQWE